MQRPWWKHPAWIHLYAIFGAVIGAFAFVIIQALFQVVLVKLLSAEAGMNTEMVNMGGLWVDIYIFAFGAFSGYFITHLFGKYRAKFASIGLIVTGILSIWLVILFVTGNIMDLIGIRANVAFYSSCVIYSLILIIWGFLILRRKAKS